MTTALTRAQVRQVDQLAVSRYRIPSLLLMENAGRGAADMIHAQCGPTGRAIVLCGTGNNGGDGCVIARHLHNAGWAVRLALAGKEDRLTPDARTNFDIVRAMAIDVHNAPNHESQQALVSTIETDDVVVDALLGTGFRGDVRSPTAELIVAVNGVPKRVMVAVDVPSGLDCDTGTASHATIRAGLTATFVATKTGFSHPAALPYVGRVEVVDIGAPRELVHEVGL